MKAELETDRIILRNLKDSDIDEFFDYRSNPETARYQSWEPYTDINEAEEYIKKYKDSIPNIPGKWFQLGIELKASSTLIGDCSIKQDIKEPKNGEIGCTISAQFQKQGFAKEATSLLIDYAFKILDLHRIVGITDCRNIGSVKLLESLGFRREGHFIKNIWFKGEWGDEFLYAILKDEWMGSK